MFKLKDKSLSSFSFVDIPHACAQDDYLVVRDKYVSSVSTRPGVEAIYQMGGISSPGISDLDLIVVLENDVQSSRGAWFTTKGMGKEAEYLFMHPGAMVTNRSTFEQLRLLIYAANLTKLFGQEIHQQTPSDQVSSYVGVAVIIDHSIHLLQALMKYVVSRKIYVRRVLMSLASIKHTLTLTKVIGIKENTVWVNFVNKMERLKNTWIQRENKPLLLDLLEEGINVLIQILHEMSCYLSEAGIVKETISEKESVKFLFLAPSSAVVFCSNPEDVYREGEYLLGKRNLMIKYGQTYVNMSLSLVALPMVLYNHVLTYTSGRSWFSLALQNIVKKEGQSNGSQATVDDLYTETMNLRIDLWAENLKFLGRHGLLAYDVMPFMGVKRVNIPGQGMKDYVKGVIERDIVLKYNQHVVRKYIWNRLYSVIAK